MHLQFFNSLHAFEAFANVVHKWIDIPMLVNIPSTVSHRDGLFFQMRALWPNTTLQYSLKICYSSASFVGRHWSVVRFSLENKYFQQSFTRVWGHETSYMRTTKFSVILMSESEGFDTDEGLINVSVASRNLPQVFHAVFFPFSRNWHTVSQSVKSYQKSIALHISCPKDLV